MLRWRTLSNLAELRKPYLDFISQSYQAGVPMEVIFSAIHRFLLCYWIAAQGVSSAMPLFGHGLGPLTTHGYAVCRKSCEQPLSALNIAAIAGLKKSLPLHHELQILTKHLKYGLGPNSDLISGHFGRHPEEILAN